MFINRYLTYNLRRKLFRRREEARQLDTHSGDATATSLSSWVAWGDSQTDSNFSFGNDRFN